MKLSRKYTTPLVGVMITVFVLSALALPLPVKAETLESLQIKLQELLEQVNVLSGQQKAQVVAPTCVLSRDLTTGSIGEDVRVLQKFLNRLGYTLTIIGNPGSPGLEYEKFNSSANNTAVPLAMYQAANGISPANGVMGPMTRSSINSKLIASDCLPNNISHITYLLGDYEHSTPGGAITLNLETEEKDGTLALKSEGFIVIGRIYKSTGNRTSDLSKPPVVGAGAVFNTGYKTWDLKLTAPPTPGNYLLKISSQCSPLLKLTKCAKVGDMSITSQIMPIEVESIVTNTPRIELVSTDTSVNAGDSANDDAGTFTIKFKVTAGANAIYVSSLADSRISGVTTGKTSVLIDRAGVAVTGGVPVVLQNITDWSLNRAGLYTIKAGESETFEFTSVVQLPTVGTTGLYRATLGGLSWGTSSTDSTPNNTISNLSTFKTSYVNLN